jgi:hypothetical protein
MADTDTPVVGGLGGLFSFFGNDPSTGGGTNYGALEARRRMALQLMANGGKKGYPKNIGEGLASLGDSLGEIGMMRALQQQEAAYQRKVDTAAGSGPPSAVPPGPQASLETPPVTRSPVASATPAAPVAALANPPVNPLQKNAIDAEADLTDPAQQNELDLAADTSGSTPDFGDRYSGVRPQPGTQTTVAGNDTLPAPVAQAAPADFTAPSYLKSTIAQYEADPAMRQYYGTLAGKEARSPNEVSSTGAVGPFQFTRGTGQQYGLNGKGFDNRTDPAASMKAVQAFTNDNIKTLTSALGRPPTMAELALAHQQGAGTAAKMIMGTGNAPPGNLAVNNVAPGASPQAAANKIMAYYGMPNTPVPGGGANPRDAVAAALVAQQPQQPLGTADAAAESRLADVVGMSRGDTGAYSYPATASRGDIMNDAPPVGITGGPGGQIGQSIGDTVQQREQMIRTLMERQNQTAPEVPQGNPTQAGPTAPILPTAATTGSPPEAANNRPIVTPDITPIPAQPAPAPGAQMAQVRMPPESQMPPAIPPPGTPAQPVPGAPSVGRTPIPDQFTQTPQPPPPLVMTPKTPDQLYYEKMKDTVAGDPYLTQIYQNKIDREEQARAFKDAQNKAAWDAQQRQYETAKSANQEFYRNAPQRELELRKAEDEAQQRAYSEGINRMLGGIPQATFIANLDKSRENVAGIPAATDSIKRANALVDKMFTGAGADIETSLTKLMGVAGFPVDPRASGTEQFKTAMAGVMAQARKGIVGPGSQSEAELALLQKSTAADAKLTPETIKATLDAAERLNLKVALQHQQQVRRFAGETDPDRQGQVYGSWGLPTATMVDLVPQASVNKLFKYSDDPKVHKDFDNTFNTPGLSREVLRLRRPQ